ncbi:MAG: hypothetical protein SVX43_00240 [Cyanobacteriota bacterium]|nr:hypothetical protein [Cyanobacteriota bacterium]
MPRASGGAIAFYKSALNPFRRRVTEKGRKVKVVEVEPAITGEQRQLFASRQFNFEIGQTTMNSEDNRERELKRREHELRQREQELRLRELEAEINGAEPPLHKTTKHNPPESKVKLWGRKLVKIAKFVGFVLVGIALVQVALVIGAWVTYLLMAGLAGGIAWIGYAIFFKDDSPKS